VKEKTVRIETGKRDLSQEIFEARLYEEIWVCFSKFSGHAPHLLSARKLPFKGSKNVDNNLWEKL
jgi:hypothetical protein